MNKSENLKRINPAMFTSDYGTIRAVREDDGILFVGVDVANAFGYGSTRAMENCKNPTKRRIEVWEGKKLKTVVTMNCIAPDDCMQLYYFSKMSKADREAVRAFIFKTIIPALNETKAAAPTTSNRRSKESREVAELRVMLKRAKDYVIETDRENAQLRQELADLKDAIITNPCVLCGNRQ